MAHAAPTTTRTGQTARRPAGGADARRGVRPGWHWPALLGVAYGLWAFAINRHGGPVTWQNILFGIVGALVFCAVCLALHKAAPRLAPEVRAASWAVFLGAAFGFLYAQSNHSIWRTCVMGLIAGGSTFVWAYYVYENVTPPWRQRQERRRVE
ncbi:hypothetical protein [Streptomyces sp. NPDC050560]|uniref:hypothetical protein n=1 Tax=Streptomyces sp. NPDC050560 TaxID=3365630 RepID=UPI0037934616